MPSYFAKYKIIHIAGNMYILNITYSFNQFDYNNCYNLCKLIYVWPILFDYLKQLKKFNMIIMSGGYYIIF